MRRQSLKERTYYSIRDHAPNFEAWRTPGRTRLLAAIYFAGLAAAIVSWVFMALSGIGPNTYLLAYNGGLLVSMAAFTVLRCTIDGKDIAPLYLLDDYEREIMNLWHDRTHRLFQIVLFVGGIIFIVAGSFFSEHFHPAFFGVSAGLFMIFTYLVVGTLPTVGFASAFNDNANDQAEELY